MTSERIAPADRFTQPTGTYLLSHSIGLLPLGVREQAVADHFDVWEQHPTDAWPHWLGEIDAFRTSLATLFNHQSSWFCPQANLSSGLTKVLQSLPRRPGRTKVLLAEEAFPSLGFVIAHSDRDIEFVHLGADVLDPEVWASHLTDDIDCVLVTHAHSNTGELVPVGPILAAARQRDIVTIVDVAQSAGVVPIDLDAWNADFVVGSCVKWLCGGPGAGYLWINPGIIDDCRPIDVGWFSHDDPFEFDIHNFRYASDAMRFWGGTPSVLPASVARRSIDTINDIGVEVIRAHNVAMVERIVDALPSGWLASPRRPEHRSGTTIVTCGESNDDLLAELTHAQIHVDQRANGIRISPHIYNTTADIDRLLEHLRT